MQSVLALPVCDRPNGWAPAQAHPSRVVLFGSIGHRLQRGPLPLDDLHFRHRWYQRFLGYGRSKFAAILFASELSRRCVMCCTGDDYADITAVHVGLCPRPACG